MPWQKRYENTKSLVWGMVVIQGAIPGVLKKAERSIFITLLFEYIAFFCFIR